MKSSIEVLFEDFQGRPVKKRIDKKIESKLPKKVYPIGKAEVVDYYVDKRDPGDPFGEGAQGFWKHFTHKHSPGVIIYSNKCDVKSDGDAYEPALEPDYPKTCIFLGQLTRIEYTDDEGDVHEEHFKNFDLWCWDNKRVLMALPRKGRINEVLIWKGGKLKVTGRGIEH